MKRTLTAIAMISLLGQPLIAQDAQLSGTVAESFGAQFVLTTPEGRVLVSPPEGSEAPATGTRLDLTGTRSGDTFSATAMTVASASGSGDAATATDPAEMNLPVALRGLGLTDIRTQPDDDGETYYFARLPSGDWLRAEAKGDRLLEVQADGAGLPEALIVALLPEAIRAEPRLADIARITEIDLDDRDEIEVEGYAEDGMRIEIEFDLSGRITDYKLERDNRRSLTEGDARARLDALGYTDIGFIRRSGRHSTALAVNPHGDMVEVRLDEQGRVERERLQLN